MKVLNLFNKFTQDILTHISTNSKQIFVDHTNAFLTHVKFGKIELTENFKNTSDVSRNVDIVQFAYRFTNSPLFLIYISYSGNSKPTKYGSYRH